MPAHQPGVWGIDLGQCALKAIRLELKDGHVVATAFDYIEHPKILSQPDADPDQLTREALESFLSRNQLKGDMVVISVPGQSGLARFVKLPPVEEKKIADIVRFEAKQQIPFPLEEVVWDFQKLSSGSLAGDFVETEIGLFAMKREMVNRALSHFKDVNVEVHVIQMAPLALCNFIAHDRLAKPADGGEEPSPGDKKNCVVALDIGTDSSNLVITDGGKIIWQRPIPIGGNHFTRALTKDLKLTFAKAEHLKRNAAKSPELKKILASLKSVLNDFVGEVQRSLGYFTNTHRDAQIEYMVGLGNAFRLPGLKQYLQEKLQLEVRKMTGFEKLTGDAVTAAPAFNENVMSFGVAYGLALQGLKEARLQTNLLPHEVRIERIIRAKKPWAVAAAAALLIAVGGIGIAKGIEYSAVMTPQNKKGQADLERAIKKADELKNKYNAEAEKLKKSQENRVRIAAGVKERFNWQELEQYVNLSLPMANGERVPDQFRIPDAKKAFEKREEMRFQKDDLPAEQAMKQDQFIKKYLNQINILGVTALYSDDLDGYFTKIKTDRDALKGMTQDEKDHIANFVKAADDEAKKKEKLPKAGWVVEIRGYTYRDEGERFIMQTFVENLRKPAFLAEKPRLDKIKEPIDKNRPDIEKKKAEIESQRAQLEKAKEEAPDKKLSPEQAKDLKKLDGELKAVEADLKKLDDQWRPYDEKWRQLTGLENEVRSKISHVFAFDMVADKDPQPGIFTTAGSSKLFALINSGGGGGVGAGPGGQKGPAMQNAGPVAGPDAKGGAPAAPKEGGNNEPAKQNRDAWKPIGEQASVVMGGGGGGGAGGGFGMPAGPKVGGPPGPMGPGIKPNVGDPKVAPAAGNGPRQPRTEFIVLLVWQEPPYSLAAAPAEEKAPEPAQKKDEKK